LLVVALLLPAVAAGGDLDKLTQKLSSHRVDTREDALQELAEMGPSAASAAGKVAELLSDEYWDVRKAAAKTLAAMGSEAVPAIHEALRSDDYWTPLYAAEAAGRMGPDASAAVPELADALDSGDRDRTLWAAWALSKMGSEAGPAVDSLTAKLKTADAFTAGYLAEAIGAVGPAALAAAPVLIARMSDVSEAGRAIGDLGPKAVSQVVAKWKKSNNKKQVWALMEAVSHMGSSAAPAIPLLEKQLTDGEDQWFTAHAARCIARIGPSAKGAAEELTQVLATHGYNDARRAAAMALGRIQVVTPQVVTALEKATKDKDSDVAAEAKKSLEMCKNAGK
ncbi:MAG: HEAT repeat domain-containing protein, partial [Phycisphaerae bacterium]